MNLLDHLRQDWPGEGECRKDILDLCAGRAVVYRLPSCECGAPIPLGESQCRCGRFWRLAEPVAVEYEETIEDESTVSEK